MKNFQIYCITAVSYFFAILFIYASVSKVLDFENFQSQIAQSPLLSVYAGSISYFTIVIEFIAVFFLMIPAKRIINSVEIHKFPLNSRKEIPQITTEEIK